jgi:hypothetical protein
MSELASGSDKSSKSDKYCVSANAADKRSEEDA